MPGARPAKSHAMPMILVATSQVMRSVRPAPLFDDTLNRCIEEVLNHFVHRDEKALLETVGPNGERIDAPEGRLVNPGHAIETAWFLMEEARLRGDKALLREACQILDWSLDLGWDRQYGGILYYVDIEGLPAEPYEHDMKLWWPHNEAIYATLLAHHLTGEAKYLDWHTRLHDWSYAHFPDREHGEWFGYLHRDGTVSSPIKGNMWKGPFHLPRMQLYAWKLLESATAKKRAVSKKAH
jgi:N-acylglucosamine 2-epimerase